MAVRSAGGNADRDVILIAAIKAMGKKYAPSPAGLPLLWGFLRPHAVNPQRQIKKTVCLD